MDIKWSAKKAATSFADATMAETDDTQPAKKGISIRFRRA